MKKKLVALLAATTILATGSLANAEYYYVHTEDEKPQGNDSFDYAEGYAVYGYSGFAISGVVSPSDAQDWFSVVCRIGHSLGTFELDLKNTGLDANLYLYDSTGMLLYKGSTVGETKLIKDIFLKDRTEYYMKVEYLSGVPKRPYVLEVLHEGLALKSLKSLPSELKEELIQEGIIEDSIIDDSIIEDIIIEDTLIEDNIIDDSNKKIITELSK